MVTGSVKLKSQKLKYLNHNKRGRKEMTEHNWIIEQLERQEREALGANVTVNRFGMPIGSELDKRMYWAKEVTCRECGTKKRRDAMSSRLNCAVCMDCEHKNHPNLAAMSW